MPQRFDKNFPQIFRGTFQRKETLLRRAKARHPHRFESEHLAVISNGQAFIEAVATAQSGIAISDLAEVPRIAHPDAAFGRLPAFPVYGGLEAACVSPAKLRLQIRVSRLQLGQ